MNFVRARRGDVYRRYSDDKRPNAAGRPIPPLEYVRDPIARPRTQVQAARMSTRPDEILCGVDDSEHSVRAAQVAGGLAGLLGTELALAHVTIPPTIPSGMAGHIPAIRLREHEAACRLMEECQELAGVTPARLLPVTERSVSIGLAQLADRTGAALLVVGCRGTGAIGRVLLGTVSAELPLSAPCPVVVVPPYVANSDVAAGAPPTIVCGVEESEASKAAAQTAGAIARATDARVVLVKCRPDEGATTWSENERRGEDGFMRTAASWCGCDDGRVEARVELGDPARRIEEVAREEDAALSIVGSRGRGAARAALLGSVSRELATDGRRPVMIVPPEGRQAGGVAA